MLALFSAPSSFFTISQAAADDVGSETQLSNHESRGRGPVKFNGDTLAFNGDTISFNGDTLSFNGDTLDAFNGDTLEKFNGDTLDGLAINTNQFGRIFEDRNGEKFTLEKFNGDTLTGFNGDTLSFNGDTLEKLSLIHI